MKSKQLLRTLAALCTALVLMGGFSVPAYAGGGGEPADETNDSNVQVEQPEETPPLTPDGNATLVDDYGGNKQLITVTTKNGNYFYILVDRDDEGENTVHFLNQVDEADLMALMEDEASEEPPAVCGCTEKCQAGAINRNCPVCAGQEFAAKGKTIQRPGWRKLDSAYHADLKNAPEPEERPEEKTLPELSEGQSLSVSNASVKEGKTSPPKHFTEDTLLSAMENAGKEDMPDTAERKGLGTPATRAGILEKLASTGFLERKKSKKTVQLMPSRDARSLITVLPEQLQSPLLTAEWEYRLGEIERGELSPEEFLSGIYAMLRELAATYQVVKGTEYLFSPPREAVGRCPRCGGEVTESQKGFFCQSETCRFAIWKDSKWWSAKKKQPTKAVVAALLKDGRARLTGCYSEKTGKTYDADVLLEDTGEYVNFKLDFGQRKGGS